MTGEVPNAARCNSASGRASPLFIFANYFDIGGRYISHRALEQARFEALMVEWSLPKRPFRHLAY
jgi:hypothetical protein